LQGVDVVEACSGAASSAVLGPDQELPDPELPDSELPEFPLADEALPALHVDLRPTLGPPVELGVVVPVVHEPGVRETDNRSTRIVGRPPSCPPCH
jgi:hypothetical protein